MSHITQEQIEHVATLARIRLSDSEKMKFSQDLDSILDFVDQLNAIDTQGIEPTAQVTGLENMLRPDDPAQARAYQDDLKERHDLLVGQAPNYENHFIKIKAIFKKQD